jgi:hypothetical protein
VHFFGLTENGDLCEHVEIIIRHTASSLFYTEGTVTFSFRQLSLAVKWPLHIIQLPVLLCLNACVCIFVTGH